MGRYERRDVDYFVNDAKTRRKKILERACHFGDKFKRKSTPKAIKLKVLLRDHLECVQCHESFKIINKDFGLGSGCYHHIIPLVYGGLNTDENICLLCKDCHNKIHSIAIGNENPEKYYQLLENYITRGCFWTRY